MKRLREMVEQEIPSKKEMSQSTFGKINFKPLLDQISKLTGVKADLTFRLDKNRRGMGIAIDSPEFITKAGIMRAVFSSIRFDSDYGSNATEENMWIALHMNWKLRDGGSNGGKVCDCWYDVKSKKWTFR